MQNSVQRTSLDHDSSTASSKFGLWCPLFDCFLMVGTNHNLLAEVQLLTSSKVVTILTELDLQDLDPNSVNNQVCSSWTVSIPESINFTLVWKRINSIPTSTIQPKKVSNLQEVDKMQAWFVFVGHWVSQLYDNINHNRDVEFINFVMNDSTPNSTKQQIYKMLLLGDDVVDVTNQIEKIL